MPPEFPSTIYKPPAPQAQPSLPINDGTLFQIFICKMNFNCGLRTLLRISCWGTVGTSVLRLFSVYSMYTESPQLPSAGQPLRWRYRYQFMSTSGVQLIASFTTGLTFGLLHEVEGQLHPVALPGSVLLLSITGQVTARLDVRILVVANGASAAGWAGRGVRSKRLSILWFWHFPGCSAPQSRFSASL